MSTDPTRSTMLLVELEELGLALDGLEGLFAAEDERARGALLGLEEDRDDLERLASMLSGWQSEIDVFDALDLDGSEEFHSNFLAWLLDPRHSHGLGDHFLREFLARSGAARAVQAGDRPSTTVSRERHIELGGESGRLDIFIHNESARFVCAVENKVWSPESGDQLAFYRKALSDHYPEHTIHRVFLTRRGEKPENPAEQDHWRTMTYTDIRQLVEEVMESERGSAHEDVMAFLRQYAITLRRNIVPEVSNDVHALARRIYRKHREAIELIIRHQGRYEPNYVSEAYRMILEVVDEQPQWRRGTSNRPYARFLSTDWERCGDLRLEAWPHRVLLFEAHVRERTADLSLYLWTGENEVLRRKVFDCVKGNSDIFGCDVEEYTEDYYSVKSRMAGVEPTEFGTGIPGGKAPVDDCCHVVAL